MMLLTKKIREQLLKNGSPENRNKDHMPVVKFFNPAGAATWLITEMDADGDTMFGLCDLGFGSPELGNVSLKELSSVRGRFGLGIERDRWWKGKHPLSYYTEQAREKGRITE